MSDVDVQSNTLASATAGLVGRLFCHPIDTIKAKLQISDKGSIRDVIRSTIKKEGLQGFYRGVGAVIIGGVPGVTVYISSYDYSKSYLLQHSLTKDRPFLAYLASGMFAEALW